MIYLLRHGETVWNTEQRMQGRLDSPLTVRGIGQAQALGQLLTKTIDTPTEFRIISSPLGRAWQSAVIVAGELGLAPKVIAREPRLTELAYGRWEGLTLEEIERRYPDEWNRRTTDRWNISTPGGESYALVARRVGAWLSGVAESDRFIVVCHGGTSRVLRGLYAGLPAEQTLDLPQPQDSLYCLSEGRFERLDSSASPHTDK